MTITDNVKEFMKANRRSPVITGAADRENGGATYRLQNNKTFHLSLDECRSLPVDFPRWKL